MKVGYGRGYYGTGQLARQLPPQRRRGSGWIKFAVVVGVGAAVWFMWPRSSEPEPEQEPGGDEPKPSTPLAPSPPSLAGQFKQLDQGAQYDSLDQVAQSRGYPSQEAYENAVVESARQLQDAGAMVTFTPRLQHLAPRLLLP